MANEPGKLYVPSGAAEIRDDFLADVRLEAINQGVANPPVQVNTDWFVLGTGLANIGLIQYANIAIGEANADVFQATGQALDNIRAARGLPVVEPAPAYGQISTTYTGGAVMVPDGTQGVLPNGTRFRTDGAQLLSGLPGGHLDVACIDAGTKGNTASGTKVKLVSPPPGVPTEATVSVNKPISGGTDQESDGRKRDRILNNLRNVPAGGNWGHMVQVAMNSLATLQQAFVYPALGGPSSVKVVLCKGFDASIRDLSRQFGASATQLVRQALQAEFPSPMEIVVQSCADERVNASVVVTLPASTLNGGGGNGWVDVAPWPPLAGGDTKVGISVVTDSSHITVSASTATAPVAGQTHIMWWSHIDQKFSTRLITAVGGGAGAWALTLDSPITDSLGANPSAGEYVSPACVNGAEYGVTWLASLERLGPGENTADANRLPRAYRHPFPQDSWPLGLTIAQLADLRNAHPEISDADWSYRSVSTPVVVASVATAPNILAPQHFGIYQL